MEDGPKPQFQPESEPISAGSKVEGKKGKSEWLWKRFEFPADESCGLPKRELSLTKDAKDAFDSKQLVKLIESIRSYKVLNADDEDKEGMWENNGQRSNLYELSNNRGILIKEIHDFGHVIFDPAVYRDIIPAEFVPTPNKNKAIPDNANLIIGRHNKLQQLIENDTKKPSWLNLPTYYGSIIADGGGPVFKSKIRSQFYTDKKITGTDQPTYGYLAMRKIDDAINMHDMVFKPERFAELVLKTGIKDFDMKKILGDAREKIREAKLYLVGVQEKNGFLPSNEAVLTTDLFNDKNYMIQFANNNGQIDLKLHIIDQ